MDPGDNEGGRKAVKWQLNHVADEMDKFGSHLGMGGYAAAG
jgi:hypothetical protein